MQVYSLHTSCCFLSTHIKILEAEFLFIVALHRFSLYGKNLSVQIVRQFPLYTYANKIHPMR